MKRSAGLSIKIVMKVAARRQLRAVIGHCQGVAAHLGMRMIEPGKLTTRVLVLKKLEVVEGLGECNENGAATLATHDGGIVETDRCHQSMNTMQEMGSRDVGAMKEVRDTARNKTLSVEGRWDKETHESEA